MHDDLNLNDLLSPSDTPAFAEQLEVAARVVETALLREGFTRTAIGRAENVPAKSKSRSDIRLTYVRNALTATVDIFEDDCQYTDSHRCFSFRAVLDAGRASEGMPFNRRRGGLPARQQWRQRTDAFLRDLHDQLELMRPAAQDGRLPAVIDEVREGYGFLRSAALSRVFFHRSALRFPWAEVSVGLPVTFTPGENDRGRVALDIDRSAVSSDVTPAQRDQATARSPRAGVHPVDAPPGADADGFTVGRIVSWQDQHAYGFIECLADPHLFIHRTALVELTRFGSYLRHRGVAFRLAQDAGGSRSAVNARLLPQDADLGRLFQQELERWPVDGLGLRGPARFHYAAQNSFDCTKEKRPTITVAALKDIITGQYLVFIHTRWLDLTPLQSTSWLELAQGVVNGFFLGEAPDTVMLSTHDALFHLNGLHSEPSFTVIPDPALKRQLEAATPHPDD